MNILNLLIRKKSVAGIEISDQVIRIAYFRPRVQHDEKVHKNGISLPGRELVLVEESIPANLLDNGIVTDQALLGKVLKDIWTRSKIDANYAIVGLPEEKIYSHVFPFPKTISESGLENAVNLAIDFQLPIKRADAYTGWEKSLEPHTANEVLISAIPKTIADGYINALNYAGIKILALESQLACIARAINTKPGVATLLTKANLDGGATIFVLRDGALRFSRTLPVLLAKGPDTLASEANRIKVSLESEKKQAIEVHSLGDATFTANYLNYPELKDLPPATQSKWLIAVGAAFRGEIPEGQDSHISLLPVGTAEAYAFQKATIFIALVRNMIIGVSVFFLATFLATYFFIFYLSQAANSSNTSILTPAVSPDTLQKEARIKKVNSIIATSETILSTTPMWGILLDDINAHILNGVYISNFSASSVNDPITITGMAKDRNTLNQFKKSLQTSTYLTAVELPIANIELKGNVPFSISFRLRDPNMLYNK